MKNLKKILVALALVAVLVSSVVTVAIADASYTGTLDDAKVLLETAEAVRGSDTVSLSKARGTELAKVYKYLNDTPVDPKTEGYGAFLEAYNKMTFEVAYCYYLEAHDPEDGALLVDKFAELYVYLAAAPAFTPDESLSIHLGYKCENGGCGAYADFTVDQLLAGSLEGLSCPAGCAGSVNSLVFANEYLYTDFRKDINDESAHHADALVSALFAASENGTDYTGYYGVFATRQALADFIKEVLEISYVAPEIEIYTGDANAAAELIADVDVDSSFDELKAALAAAYSYLVENPVNPTTDEYLEFITKYYELCDVLVGKLKVAVDNAASANDKVAALADFRTYLMGYETEEGFVKGTLLSASVVEDFNELRLDVAEELEKISADLGEVEELDISAVGPVYSADYKAFKKLVEDMASIPATDANMPFLIEELYTKYATVSAYAADSNDYEEVIAKYNEVAVNYLESAYVAKMDSLVRAGDKFTVLANMHSFIKQYPLSEEAIAVYNDARLSLLEDARELSAKISGNSLPVYVEPEKAEPTVSELILNSLLNKLVDSYDKYDASLIKYNGAVDNYNAAVAYSESLAEGAEEEKAAALAAVEAALAEVDAYRAAKDSAYENMKVAMADLRANIVGSVMDTEAEYYAEFLTRYSNVRDNVVKALFATVDAAAEADKAAAIKALGEYLSATPVTRAAVEKYNALVDDSMKISSIYFDFDKDYANAASKELSFDERIDAVIRLSKYMTRSFDITDPAYADAVEKYNAIVDATALEIEENIIVALTELPLEEALAIVDDRLAFVKEVYTYSLVMSFRKAVKSTADTCDSIIVKIEENNAVVAYYTSVNEKATAILDAFDAAESVDERCAIYSTLYNNYCSSYNNVAFMAGSSYSAFKARYDAAGASLADELIAMMSIEQAPDVIYDNLAYVRAYISATPFSDAVIAAYNESVNAANEADFAQYADKIINEVEAVTYATPEGWSPNLSRVILALELAIDNANGLSVKDTKEFYVAYKILSGIAGVDGPKVIDFGVKDFLPTINIFDGAKDKIVSDYTVAVNNSESINEKIYNLKDLGAFIKEYPFSKQLVDFYNSVRAQIIADYEATEQDTFQAVSDDVAVVHDFLEKCPINESLLSKSDRSKLAAMKNLLEACEYLEVSGSIGYFNSLSGDRALIYQNATVDKLNWYTRNYGLSAYSESLLASSQIKVSFINMLDAIDAELAGLSEDEEAKNRVYTLGAYIVNNGFSRDLVDMFNERYAAYGANFVAEPVAPGEGNGTVADVAELVKDFNFANGVDAKRIALAKLVEYVNENPLDSANQYEETMQSIEDLRALLAEKTEEQKEKLDLKADLAEYDMLVERFLTHEDNKLYTTSLSQNADKTATHTIQTESENKYAQLAVTSSASPYFNMAIQDSSLGIVIELDVMSPDKLNFQLNFTEDGLNYGQRVTTRALLIKEGQLVYKFGDYSATRDDQGFPEYQEGVHEPILLTPGEWMHITIVMDVEAQEMECLVDYVSLGRKPIITAASSGGKEDTCKFTSLRFQSPAKNSTICYDNVKVYRGTSYRTTDKFETMTNEDKFTYYATFAMNDEAAPVNRLYAYYAAMGLKDFVGAECDAIKTEFEDFKVEEIEKSAQEIHMQRIETFVAGIDVGAMTSANIADMGIAIDTANNYIEANRLYIDQSSDRFIEANAVLIEAAAKREWLQNLDTYIDELQRLHRATSHAALVRHFETVTEYYNLCRLDRDAERELAELDPAVKQFVDVMLLDPSVLELTPNLTFSSYYLEYIPKRINQQLCYENSFKILDCIGFIENGLQMPDRAEFESSDAYYAELLARASANKALVDPYVTVIRDIVNASLYNADVDGIEVALETYNKLDEMFFEELQTQHFAIIKANLDRYAKTDSYIEKAGICTFVENYIKDNNVDMTGVDGVQCMYALEIYKAELDAYKLDYEAILAANTAAFIGTVQKMGAYKTYAELKPLYDEAITNYYYSMNVDSEEVKAAIAEFAVYEAMITEWEYNASMFIGYANTLADARRQSHQFRAIVNCTKYIDKLDEGVEGVSEALEIYNKGLADYNKIIDPVNKEVAEAMDIVGSLRTNSVTATVLAAIQTIISK